jgi:hypothetical protein
LLYAIRSSSLIERRWCYITDENFSLKRKFNMKKVLSAIAILSLVTGQAFAQTAPEAPAVAAEAAAAPAATTAVAAAPAAGLSVAAMVSIGVALAAVAAVASDNSTTTTHHK